jgi:hypothetical protein
MSDDENEDEFGEERYQFFSIDDFNSFFKSKERGRILKRLIDTHELHFDDIEEFMMISEIPPNVSRIEIRNCPKLRIIPHDSQMNVTSLKIKTESQKEYDNLFQRCHTDKMNLRVYISNYLPFKEAKIVYIYGATMDDTNIFKSDITILYLAACTIEATSFTKYSSLTKLHMEDCTLEQNNVPKLPDSLQIIDITDNRAEDDEVIIINLTNIPKSLNTVRNRQIFSPDTQHRIIQMVQRREGANFIPKDHTFAGFSKRFWKDLSKDVTTGNVHATMLRNRMSAHNDLGRLAKTRTRSAVKVFEQGQLDRSKEIRISKAAKEVMNNQYVVNNLHEFIGDIPRKFQPVLEHRTVSRKRKRTSSGGSKKKKHRTKRRRGNKKK